MLGGMHVGLYNSCGLLVGTMLGCWWAPVPLWPVLTRAKPAVLALAAHLLDKGLTPPSRQRRGDALHSPAAPPPTVQPSPTAAPQLAAPRRCRQDVRYADLHAGGRESAAEARLLPWLPVRSRPGAAMAAPPGWLRAATGQERATVDCLQPTSRTRAHLPPQQAGEDVPLRRHPQAQEAAAGAPHRAHAPAGDEVRREIRPLARRSFSQQPLLLLQQPTSCRCRAAGASSPRCPCCSCASRTARWCAPGGGRQVLGCRAQCPCCSRACWLPRAPSLNSTDRHNTSAWPLLHALCSPSTPRRRR